MYAQNLALNALCDFDMYLRRITDITFLALAKTTTVTFSLSLVKSVSFKFFVWVNNTL